MYSNDRQHLSNADHLGAGDRGYLPSTAQLLAEGRLLHGAEGLQPRAVAALKATGAQEASNGSRLLGLSHARPQTM